MVTESVSFGCFGAIGHRLAIRAGMGGRSCANGRSGQYQSRVLAGRSVKEG